MKRGFVAGLAVLAFGGTAYAQDSQEIARKKATETEAVMARMPLEKTITGAPYSADLLIENTQALADGNRIARRTTGHVYRDSQGRTRREQDNGRGEVTISIVDPVAGVSYQLDAANHIAWRNQNAVAVSIMKRQADELQARAAAIEATTVARGRSGGEGGTVAAPTVAPGGMLMRTPAGDASLEHKVIDGIPVEGRTSTRTIPAGRIGNELPITVVSEQWSSPDLGVLVMTHLNDPRTGESTYRLSNIVRAEPDPSLFVVPPGYEVRDTGIKREQK